MNNIPMFDVLFLFFKPFFELCYHAMLSHSKIIFKLKIEGKKMIKLFAFNHR